MLPAMPDRGGLCIGIAKPEIVAGVAADDMARGQSRIEIEHLSEFDLCRGRGVAGQLGCCRRDRLELLPCFCHQIILREREGGHRQETAYGQQYDGGVADHGILLVSLRRRRSPRAGQEGGR